MNTKHWLALAFLFLAASIHCEEKEKEKAAPQDLTRLMESYQEQRSKGLQLLNDRFLLQLSPIKMKHMTAGDLEASVEVQNAIDRLEEENNALSQNAAAKTRPTQNFIWAPNTKAEFEKLLMAHQWNWIEQENNQKASFHDGSNFRIEGRIGNFGWEVTSASTVTLKLGAARRQDMFFRLSPSTQQLLPTEGTSKSRNIILEPR